MANLSLKTVLLSHKKRVCIYRIKELYKKNDTPRSTKTYQNGIVGTVNTICPRILDFNVVIYNKKWVNDRAHLRPDKLVVSSPGEQHQGGGRENAEQLYWTYQLPQLYQLLQHLSCQQLWTTGYQRQHPVHTKVKK